MTKARPNVTSLTDHQARAQHYADVLRDCIDSHIDVSAAVLATIDGIEIASQKASNAYRPAQLAAMASSLLAVAGAAGREVGHAYCARLVVQSESGTLLIRPVGEHSLVLCIALPPRTLLGNALLVADRIAKNAMSH